MSIISSRCSPQSLNSQLRELQDKYNDLEDAVLLIEEEKADWAKRMDDTSRQLADEFAKRQHFEQLHHDTQAELAAHRNTVAEAEREMSKAASDIKARDAEIALLRSRENKTIVEHVHVLESAKKVTDRQLAEQVKENSRLNAVMKSLETHRNRLVMDLEDMTRERDVLKANQGRAVRTARASMSSEDKDAQTALAEERKARKMAEERIASLERDLQDQRKQLSTSTISAANAAAAEHKLQKKQDELWRLEAAHEEAMEENQRLYSQVSALQRQLASQQPPSTPKSAANRAELLRGLQQSHDVLGRDMSDQLRRLDAQPLTPSKKTNSNYTGLGM